MTYHYPDTRTPKAIKIDNTKCLPARVQNNMDYQIDLLGKQNHAVTLRKSRSVSFEVRIYTAYSRNCLPKKLTLKKILD